MTTSDRPPRSLQPLFSPRSVAVVGASADPRKWGHWLAAGALRGTHRRPAFLVNPGGGEILGQPVHRSLAEIGEPVELVAVALGWTALPAAVDEALAAGAGAIVAIGAGGEASRAQQAQLAARVRAAGAVLLGPNCLGVLDNGEDLQLTSDPLPPGSIGLISQSGNLALELAELAASEELGFSRLASVGDQADLGVTELLHALAAHEPTRLIALYVEDFGDGRGFARAAARAVAAGTPVVALAIERTAATTRSVGSHTGALASDGAVIDAVCRAAGIHRVATPTELIDVAQALLRAPRARGRRLAVLADGGGHGAVATASALTRGLTVPELSPGCAARLTAALPDGAGTTNPIDLAGAAERDLPVFARVAGTVLDGDEADGLLVTGFFGGYDRYGPQSAAAELETAGALGSAGRRSPIVVHTMFPRGPAASRLRACGIPVYPTVERAVTAMGALARPAAADPDAVPALAQPAPSGPHPWETDETHYEVARRLLADAGVPFAAQRTVRTPEQALQAAAEIGYPVVLKALGATHKSEGGGVVLAIPDAHALARAQAEMDARLAPGRCSIEACADTGAGVEILIGARWDPRFGPVALAGAGGVYAEILDDTAVALAPVTVHQAERMLRALRIGPLLGGARGRPAVDVAAAARALADLSQLAAAHPELSELEINPLLVTPEGALALDARLIPAPETRGDPA